MKKSVLLSIKPKWCELIAIGKKTIEVRKTRPKYEPPFKVYIYCAKGNVDLSHYSGLDGVKNGRVIGEFVCERILPIVMFDGLVDYVDCELSCLSAKEIIEYSGGKKLYGWRISNLVIYNKPRELSSFGLSRPPQSWCYVEEII